MVSSEPSKPIAFVVDATQRIHVRWHVAADKGEVARAAVEDIGAIIEHYQAMRCQTSLWPVFDGRNGAEWRRGLMPEYKSNRTKDEGLEAQIDQAFLDLSPAAIRMDDQEADDVIGTVTRVLVERGNRVVIVSRDKDFRQLLQDGWVSIMHSFSRGRGGFQAQFETAKSFREEFGFNPSQYVEYLGMVGDTSDSVAGWAGVGEKRAAQLLRKHTVDGWIKVGREDIKELPTWARDGFGQFAERWPVIRQVLTINTNVAGVPGL